MEDRTPLEEAIVELNQIKINMSDAKNLTCTCLTFRPILNDLMSPSSQLLYSDIVALFQRQTNGEMLCNCEGISNECDDVACAKCASLKSLTLELASKQQEVNTLIQSQIGTTIDFTNAMDPAFN